jgi:hypothetical protein
MALGLKQKPKKRHEKSTKQISTGAATICIHHLVNSKSNSSDFVG